MECCSREHLRVISFESGDNLTSGPTKAAKDRIQRMIVMVALIGLAIGHIGRVQDLRSAFVFVQPSHHKRFEVQKVSSVFLNGPTLTIAAGENFGSERLQSIFKACRRTTDALNHFGKQLNWKVEFEFAFRPRDS